MTTQDEIDEMLALMHAGTHALTIESLGYAGGVSGSATVARSGAQDRSQQDLRGERELRLCRIPRQPGDGPQQAATITREQVLALEARGIVDRSK